MGFAVNVTSSPVATDEEDGVTVPLFAEFTVTVWGSPTSSAVKLRPADSLDPSEWNLRVMFRFVVVIVPTLADELEDILYTFLTELPLLISR